MFWGKNTASYLVSPAVERQGLLMLLGETSIVAIFFILGNKVMLEEK